MSSRIALPLLLLVLGFSIANPLDARAQSDGSTPSLSETQVGEIKATVDREATVETGQESGEVPGETQDATRESQEAELQKLLTGAKLKGSFTTDGKPLSDLQDETYEIRKIQRLKPDSDTWVILARIQYGQHDVLVPVPIKITWADSTPVLSMDQMSVPGLGTFSARVVLHGRRYAGTWQHDAVGGHLFGTITTAQDNPASP
jgi:hypothetical protein